MMTKDQVLAAIAAGKRTLVWSNASNRPRTGQILKYGDYGIQVATGLKTVPVKTVTWHCPILEVR